MTRTIAGWARTVTVFACFVVLAFGSTLALAMSVPVLFGYQSLTMLSGSMGPAIPTGAIVIDETIRPLDARPGDVVTFTDPKQPERLLTHRLRSITVEGNSAYMVTRGDANDSSEKWAIPLDGAVGRVKTSVPLVGFARSWVHQNTGRTTMIVVLSAVGLWTLLDVWLPVPLSVLVRRTGRPGARRGSRIAVSGAAALSGKS